MRRDSDHRGALASTHVAAMCSRIQAPTMSKERLLSVVALSWIGFGSPGLIGMQLVFSNSPWPNHKIRLVLWRAFLDHARGA